MALITNRKITPIRLAAASMAILLVGVLSGGVTLALSKGDINSIVNDTTFYDPDSGCATTTTSGGTGSQLYVIGDSLTVGMNSERLKNQSLGAVLEANGWRSTINAQGCRPLYNNQNPSGFEGNGSGCPRGTITSAFNELPKDTSAISTATKIVIALGTNRYEADAAQFETKANEYIGEIRKLNPNIANNIYWVNLYTKGGSNESINQRSAIIDKVVKAQNIQLIDYHSAGTDERTYSFAAGDSTHLDDNGYINKAKLIADAVGKSTASTSPSGPGASTGSSDPISLSYPAFPDEAQLAASIDSYLRSKYPSSPWLRIPNFGAWLLRETKARGVNPLIVIGSGKIENAFGTVGSNPRVNNNFFGMKGRGGYLHFNTAEEGMIAFFDALKRNIIDKSHPSYKDVTNMYEYYSVHQTGGIHYPGDGLNLKDPQMPNVVVSWSSPYNPGNYWKGAVGAINAVTGLSISTQIPPRGSSSSFAGCETSAKPSGTAAQYIKDCAANGGNAKIACVAINELMGIEYSMEKRAPATDPNPAFLDCSAMVNMAIYRAFQNDLKGMCSAEFLTNRNFKEIDVRSIQPGDMVGKGSACGGAGHIAIVVSYDPATKKLITVETGSTKYLSGLRGIGGESGYNVGLAVDGNGSYEWAVHYVGQGGGGSGSW